MAVKIGIGNFAVGGQYLVLVDGVTWAKSKSYSAAKSVAMALAIVEAAICEDTAAAAALVIQFIKARSPRLTVRAADLQLEPVHVDEALEYEDHIAHWPRYTETDRSDKQLMHLGPRKVTISSRVGDRVIEYSYGWDEVRDKEGQKYCRRHALAVLDRDAREAWDEYVKRPRS